MKKLLLEIRGEKFEVRNQAKKPRIKLKILRKNSGKKPHRLRMRVRAQNVTHSEIGRRLADSELTSHTADTMSKNYYELKFKLTFVLKSKKCNSELTFFVFLGPKGFNNQPFPTCTSG